MLFLTKGPYLQPSYFFFLIMEFSRIESQKIDHPVAFWGMKLEAHAFIYLSSISPSKEIVGTLICPQTSPKNSSKIYYKVLWLLLQSATSFFVTKCDSLLLQSATAILLQSVTCYYKV